MISAGGLNISRIFSISVGESPTTFISAGGRVMVLRCILSGEMRKAQFAICFNSSGESFIPFINITSNQIFPLYSFRNSISPLRKVLKSMLSMGLLIFLKVFSLPASREGQTTSACSKSFRTS